MAICVLQGAQKSLKDTVRLSKCEGVDLGTFTTPMEFLTAANNPEVIEALEKCMLKWSKEIEQVRIAQAYVQTHAWLCV